MRLHFTRFLHGFCICLDRDVLCCPQNIGELRYKADAILGQHFDDSGFVWLWFIWQQLLLWYLGAGICSARCVIAGATIALCTQRYLFCRRYLGMMFSPARKHTARIAAATCTRTETFDSTVIFRYAGYDDHAKAGIP